ncbi:sulfate/molybdate ABC transporter ATP-binding protein [Aureispira anguillae]|uniref:ATP-binding cassette domain-containing protein n=1 Tax=Aureispira anguillae TaxID=2864201 RepID=A0A915YBA0_9BACT|nr:ATP-binding cassette domain-containing protein [Aureispira anguillae]BDS09883.1 ATP-binding cassette domain-containing protein [Aureispira anguillae]
MIEFDLYKQLETTQGCIQLRAQMELTQGDLVAIYGPSGAGKTTLLRMLAGLTKPSKGYLKVNAIDWYNSKTKVNLVPQKRKVGFVFQDYALFPNMTVLENLRFASTNMELIHQLLKETNLVNLQAKRPAELSGGQQQRVALVRALAMQPSILLLDEPLSALNYELRQAMQTLIANLHQRYTMTTLMVSHDIPEIVQLATKVLVLKGEKATLYHDPIAYFKQQNLLQEIQVEGIVQAIKKNSIQLKVGTALMTFVLPPSTKKDIQVGDKISITSFVLQPQVSKIDRI